MNLKDALAKLTDTRINDAFVWQLEKMYARSLPDEIKLIVSLSEETVFYDDFPLLRGLSNPEIAKASEDMHVDFIGKKLIPLFDVGDNDFIVFDLAEKVWYKFNIVDEIKFSPAGDLNEYLP